MVKFSESNIRMGRTACTEENELLNANSIKMTDAPFGRSDSEDDILEDYDDVVSFKGPCCKGRTPLERGLLVLLVLLIVVIVGLAVGLTRPYVIPQKEYCKTPECVQAASSIMAAMNPEVDPCEDFFEYACGGWVRENPIPKGYHKWDRVQELSGKNLYVLKNLIDGDHPNHKADTAEGKVRTFYRSCMAEDTTTRPETLRRMVDILQGAYGWTVSRASNASKWHFPLALEKVHLLGAWPLFKVSVDVDERNPTERYILKIDVGETVLPSDMYPPRFTTPAPTTSTPSTTPSDDDSIDNSSAIDYSTPLSSSSESIPSSSKAPSRNSSEARQYFADESVYILESLGFNRTAAQFRAQQMAELEESISEAMEDKTHNQDRFLLYNVISLAELESNFSMVGA